MATYVQGASYAPGTSGPHTTISVSLSGVASGNLIVVWVGWNDTDTTPTASDGTSSMTAGVRIVNGNTYAMHFWLLSANSGNRTYTVTFPTAALWPAILVMEFSQAGGPWTTDGTNGNTGTGTAVTTGNITTSGTADYEVIVASAFNSSGSITGSSCTIGGITQGNNSYYHPVGTRTVDSYPHNLAYGSGNNRILIVGFSADNGGTLTCKYNSVPMTALTQVNNTQNTRIFYMLDADLPASAGSYLIETTSQYSVCHKVAATDFKNVDQAVQDDYDTSTGFGTSHVTTTTVSVANSVVWCFSANSTYTDNTWSSHTSGATIVGELAGGSLESIACATYKIVDSTGDVTFTDVCTVDGNMANAIVVFAPYIGGSAVEPSCSDDSQPGLTTWYRLGTVSAGQGACTLSASYAWVARIVAFKKSTTALTADPGSFAVTGTAATLTYRPAFAYVNSNANYTNTTLGTGMALNMPSGIVAGDLLIAFAANDNPGTTNMAMAGWTQLFQTAYTGNVVKHAAFAKIAVGGDTGTLTGAAQDVAAKVCLIKNHGVSDIASQVRVGTPATGATWQPNPPSLTTPASARYLWLASFGADDDDGGNATPYPTSFTGLGEVESAQTTSSCMISVAYRQYLGQILDPGTFNLTSSSTSEEWVANTIAIPPFVLGQNYTVAADTTSYSVTGTAANLEYGRKFAASGGAYTETGTAAVTLYKRHLDAGEPSYTVTGFEAIMQLRSGMSVVASEGAYTVTGTAANLEYGREVATSAGTFTETGTAVALKSGRVVVGSGTAYSVTGSEATVRWSAFRGVRAEVAAFSVTGSAAGVLKGRGVTAASASVTLTGGAASIRSTYRIAGSSAAFAESGASVTLRKTMVRTHNIRNATAGAFTGRASARANVGGSYVRRYYR